MILSNNFPIIQYLQDYLKNNDNSFFISQEKIDHVLRDFKGKFGIDVIKNLEGKELLETLFCKKDDNNVTTRTDLNYVLEYSEFDDLPVGSIAGGSAHKFGLFKRKDQNGWSYGSSSKNEVLLTEDQAIQKANLFKQQLLNVDDYLKSHEMHSVEDYKNFEDYLYSNNSTTKDSKDVVFCTKAFFHKYLSLLYPTVFYPFHNNSWQFNILMSFGIEPCNFSSSDADSSGYFVRDGQIKLLANEFNLNSINFAQLIYKVFKNRLAFYLIGTSDNDGEIKYFPDWKKSNIAAIGFNRRLLGDLRTRAQRQKIEKEDLKDYIDLSDNKRVASKKASEICEFYNLKDKGFINVFIAKDGFSLLAITDEIGEYHFDENQPFSHIREAHWHEIFKNGEQLPNSAKYRYTSFKEVSDLENLMYLYKKYYCYKFGIQIPNEDNSVVVDQTKISSKDSDEFIKTVPLNQILYGAPGTGKTYCSSKMALEIVKKHPIDEKVQDRASIFSEYKEYVKSGQIVFTTFHQSYGYEDFIQGIRPILNGTNNLQFKQNEGVFKALADRAKNDPNQNYVIIIDEINRGNISKIFGELITLIEEDKRLGADNEITVTLPSGEKFEVPSNLYILGTMNTADKSISLIDSALRRRFDFIEVAPNPSLIADTTLKVVLEKLNEYLEKKLNSTDLLIGHAFFINKTVDELTSIMNQKIIPLLYEYFFDNKQEVTNCVNSCLDGTEYKVDDTCSYKRISVVKA